MDSLISFTFLSLIWMLPIIAIFMALTAIILGIIKVNKGPIFISTSAILSYFVLGLLIYLTTTVIYKGSISVEDMYVSSISWPFNLFVHWPFYFVSRWPFILIS